MKVNTFCHCKYEIRVVMFMHFIIVWHPDSNLYTVGQSFEIHILLLI